MLYVQQFVMWGIIDETYYRKSRKFSSSKIGTVPDASGEMVDKPVFLF